MTAKPGIRVEPVTPERWDDVVALFERPGPRGGTPIPGNCWCMLGRGNARTVAARKQTLADLVSSGPEPGLLAYRDGEPVGWVSVAPRTGFPALMRSRTLRPAPGEDEALDDIFLVTCLYVDPRARRDLIASALLDAAVDHAASRGATAIEAFPKKAAAPHTARSSRAEENDSYMGRRGSFERRGFEVARTAGARVVLRRKLR